MRLVLLLVLLAAMAPRSTEPKAIAASADVEIDSRGIPTKITVTRPPLSREMAVPIEEAVRRLQFTAGYVDGSAVQRTTSVALVLRLVPDSEGKNTIQLEKIAEGPRVETRARSTCLSRLSPIDERGIVKLAFTVTATGTVVDLTVAESTATKSDTECAIEITASTIFKPDTLRGKPIPTSITQYFDFAHGEPSYAPQPARPPG